MKSALRSDSRQACGALESPRREPSKTKLRLSTGPHGSCVLCKHAPPVAFSVEDTTHLIAPSAVTIESTMLELYARNASFVIDESDFDLGVESWIGLPVRIDVPRQHEP